MVFTYSTLYTLSTSSRTTSTKSGTPRRPSTQVAFVVLEPDSLRRKALVHWAGRLSGYECKGAFASVQEAIPFLDRSGASLDLLLYHRQLADLPQTTLKRLLERCDGHLLAVSYHTYDNSDELFFSQPGISEGYYFRRRTPDQILEPLDALWQLRPVPKQAYATELSRYVNRVFTGFDTRPKPIGGAELTARETQILRCLSEGLADKEISVRLQISTWTVHTHLKRIYQKLKVRSRTEAVIRHSQM